MASGGARNRSGPQADPKSGRSERRGVKLTALPAEGYIGSAPDWPLPGRTVFRWEYEEKSKYQVADLEASQAVADREIALWEWAWRTPQAAAWSLPSESWRLHTIAMWVRTYVICEGSEATAADKSALHRFADQIGLTPAGLRENGWAIAQDEVGARRADREADSGPAAKSEPKVRRLRG